MKWILIPHCLCELILYMVSFYLDKLIKWHTVELWGGDWHLFGGKDKRNMWKEIVPFVRNVFEILFKIRQSQWKTGLSIYYWSVIFVIPLGGFRLIKYVVVITLPLLSPVGPGTEFITSPCFIGSVPLLSLDWESHIHRISRQPTNNPNLSIQTLVSECCSIPDYQSHSSSQLVCSVMRLDSVFVAVLTATGTSEIAYTVCNCAFIWHRQQLLLRPVRPTPPSPGLPMCGACWAANRCYLKRPKFSQQMRRARKGSHVYTSGHRGSHGIRFP